METADAEKVICKMWIWATLWSMGCNMTDAARILLEIHMRKVIGQSDYQENLPKENLWLCYINQEIQDFDTWESIVPDFVFSPTTPFFDLYVPTLDTVRFGYVAKLLLRNDHPVMFTGVAGVGKSIIAREILVNGLSKEDMIPVMINFSAKTSSLGTQNMIEEKLEKRKKTMLGPPIGKKMIIFVDDVSMPKMDTYGSQAPIELLRQLVDLKGLYDRPNLFLWRDIEDVILSAACSPIGNKMNKRFVRQFGLLALPLANTNTMTSIVGCIIQGFLNPFTKNIVNLVDPITLAAVSLYEKVSNHFLPTPMKSHYLFNLRDLSKCVQGVLQASPSAYNQAFQMMRLFYHESLRVFYDRLVNDQDKNQFKELMKGVCME
jgi:dynein heavy chain